GPAPVPLPLPGPPPVALPGPPDGVHDDITSLQVVESQLGVPDNEPIVAEAHVAPFRLLPSHSSPSSMAPLPHALAGAPSSLPPHASRVPAAITQRMAIVMGSLAFIVVDLRARKRATRRRSSEKAPRTQLPGSAPRG